MLCGSHTRYSLTLCSIFFFFFFQAEDGIRDHCVTGVQTCALPISKLDSENTPTTFGNRTIHSAPRLTGGPELVPVMDDARLPFLAKFPEGGLDLHPDRDILGFYVDQLRREPDALVHLDDRHHVGLLHLELGRCVVDDRVRDDGPLAAEPETLHLADRLATTDRADGPWREVAVPAAAALCTDNVVSGLDSPPESGAVDLIRRSPGRLYVWCWCQCHHVSVLSQPRPRWSVRAGRAMRESRSPGPSPRSGSACR